MALNKEMSYSFIITTIATFLIPMPTSSYFLLRITPWWRNRRKTFTFKGSFNFHKDLLNGITLSFSISLYIGWIENIPLFRKDHMNMSGWSTSWTHATFITNSCQFTRLFLLRALQKETLRGVEDITFFYCVMLSNCQTVKCWVLIFKTSAPYSLAICLPRIWFVPHFEA